MKWFQHSQDPDQAEGGPSAPPPDAAAVSVAPVPSVVPTPADPPPPALVPSPVKDRPVVPSEAPPTFSIGQIAGAVAQSLTKAASDHDQFAKALYAGRGEGEVAAKAVVSKINLALKLAAVGQKPTGVGNANEPHFVLDSETLADVPADRLSTVEFEIRMDRSADR